VIKTKGQYICGSITCDEKSDIHSYELPFQYIENSITKFELVKVRLCSKCSKKLYKKKLKEAKHSNDNNTKRISSTITNNDENDTNIEIIENPKKKKLNPEDIVDVES
jgi:hypothetical protein